MRWKAHFFLNNNDETNKEEKRKAKLFEFKSKYHPGQLKKLGNFEKNLFKIATSFKFRKLNAISKKK